MQYIAIPSEAIIEKGGTAHVTVLIFLLYSIQIQLNFFLTVFKCLAGFFTSTCCALYLISASDLLAVLLFIYFTGHWCETIYLLQMEAIAAALCFCGIIIRRDFLALAFILIQLMTPPRHKHMWIYTMLRF